MSGFVDRVAISLKLGRSTRCRGADRVPTHLVQLFEGRTFTSLHEMLAVWAEPSGLCTYSHAGAFLYRQNPELPTRVAWVNVEVPSQIAPGIDNRYQRMYPIAIQSAEKDYVLDLHPWVVNGTDTLGPNSLALSQVMDRWKEEHSTRALYFVIDLNEKRDLKSDALWTHFYDQGFMVHIAKENGRFVLRHRDVGEVDLLAKYGPGKRFWIENWLTFQWHGRVGYYVGIEAASGEMSRIWAALGPDAPLSAVTTIQTLCYIVHYPQFISCVETIPGARAVRRSRHLFVDSGGRWHLEFDGVSQGLPGKTPWVYVDFLLHNSGKLFTEQELFQLQGAQSPEDKNSFGGVAVERGRSGALRPLLGGISQRDLGDAGFHVVAGPNVKERQTRSELDEEGRAYVRYLALVDSLAEWEKAGDAEGTRRASGEISSLQQRFRQFVGTEQGATRQRMVNSYLAKINRPRVSSGGEVGSVAKALQRVRSSRAQNPNERFREYLRQKLVHWGDSWMHAGLNWD